MATLSWRSIKANPTRYVIGGLRACFQQGGYKLLQPPARLGDIRLAGVRRCNARGRKPLPHGALRHRA